MNQTPGAKIKTPSANIEIMGGQGGSDMASGPGFD